MKTTSLLTLALAALSQITSAQDLWVVNDASDSVMVVSGVDGSILDSSAVDLIFAPTLGLPIEAMRVNDEIWISDQTGDTLHRFSLDGSSFLGDIGTTRDNVRGFAFVNGSVYLTNSGTAGGAPGDVVKEYATDGSLLNSFAAPDPFDVVEFNGELLVSNILDDNLERYAYDGTFLGVFHDSDGVTGINFPEQLTVTPSGTIMAGGFSPPEGIYEYDASGNQINYYDTMSSVRAAYPLANGHILFTGPSGLSVYDRANQATWSIIDESCRFISLEGATVGTNYCMATPNSLGFPAEIVASGSLSVAANSIVLRANQVPDQPGLFFYGPSQTVIPFGNGFLCITGTIGRLSVENATGNVITHVLDNTNPPNAATVISGGSTWNFQCWFRDPTAGGAAFNLSDAIELTFTP